MRDGSGRASSADVGKLQSHLYTYLSHLVQVFAIHKQRYGQIPYHSALEFRYFCVHGVAFHERPHDNNAKYRHMQAMISHAQQAMLAAYRELIAKRLHTDKSPKTTEDTGLIKEFAVCRVRELQEGFSGEYTNTALRYRQLLDKLHQWQTTRQDAAQKRILATFNPQMWLLIREWLELDLLLSAIVQDSDGQAGPLQLLIESLLFYKDDANRDSLLRLQTCLIIQKLQILLITMHTYKEDFEIFAKSKNSLHIPAYFKNHIRNEQRSDFSHYIDLVHKSFPLVARYWELKYAQG
ncbi:MAG: hypothetical protein IJD16_05850 [Desulfovibrio sp.]|nr:hypothetical protein [Desulfovibrio sp.]